MKNLWYAVMRNRDDNDWGYGFHNCDEAIQKAMEMRENNPDIYIAVIEEGNDPICIDEIYLDDDFVNEWKTLFNN